MTGMRPSKAWPCIPLVNDFELAETLTDIFFDKYAEFIHMNETP